MTKEGFIMPKGIRRSFTKEFKLSAVYLMLSKQHNTGEICTMLDIDRQTLHRWVQEFKADGEKAFDDKSVLPGDVASRIQQQKIDELEMENEILKKAIAYFAEQHKKK